MKVCRKYIDIFCKINRVQYGSIIWWPGVERTITGQKLAKSQHLVCLGIRRAMETTPIDALVVLSVLPDVSTRKRESGRTRQRAEDTLVGTKTLFVDFEEANHVSPKKGMSLRDSTEKMDR